MGLSPFPRLSTTSLFPPLRLLMGRGNSLIFKIFRNNLFCNKTLEASRNSYKGEIDSDETRVRESYLKEERPRIGRWGRSGHLEDAGPARETEKAKAHSGFREETPLHLASRQGWYSGRSRGNGGWFPVLTQLCDPGQRSPALGLFHRVIRGSFLHR